MRRCAQTFDWLCVCVYSYYLYLELGGRANKLRFFSLLFQYITVFLFCCNNFASENYLSILFSVGGGGGLLQSSKEVLSNLRTRNYNNNNS